MSEDNSNEIIRSPLFPSSVMQTYKTVDEFRDALKTTDRRVMIADNINTVKFNHDMNGKLMIDFGSGPYGFTETGFERFCKKIHVPASFVSALPCENSCKDLLASIYQSKIEQVNFIVKDNKIVGASDREDTVSTLEIVDRLFSSASDKKLKEIGVYREKALIYFTKEGSIPLVDDPIDYGLCVTHDDSTASNPSLDFYFFRQICSNGAVSRHIEKISKLSNRMDKMQMFDVLTQRVEQSLDYVNSTLSAAVRSMSTAPILSDDKKYLKMYLTPKLRFKENEYIALKYDELIGQKDNATYYDLMNFVTDSAKDFAIDERHRLMALGGDMVAHFKSQKATLDVFKGFNEFKRQKMHKEHLANA